MAESLSEKNFYHGQPGTSDGTLNLAGNATVPANHKYTISTILIANTSGSNATVTLARGGTTATAANQIVPTVTIPANTVEIIRGPFVFEAGDSLHGVQGTSGAITLDINGADHQLS